MRPVRRLVRVPRARGLAASVGNERVLGGSADAVGGGLRQGGRHVSIHLPQASAERSGVHASIDRFGRLKVVGTRDADEIVLPLQQGDPNDLEHRAGSDDVPEPTFERSRFDHILVVAGRGGDDPMLFNGVDVITVNDLANAEPTDELALDGAAAVDSTGLTPGTISLLVDGVPA